MMDLRKRQNYCKGEEEKMRDELAKLSSDIKKVQQAESILATVHTRREESELEKLIRYALHCNIIKSTLDLILVCNENPESQAQIADIYDAYMKEQKEAAEKAVRESRRYAGTYNSLSEVPGYGTEWNSRCVPDGVIIRGRNGRC